MARSRGRSRSRSSRRSRRRGSSSAGRSFGWVPRGRLSRTRPAYAVTTGYLKTKQKVASQLTVDHLNPFTAHNFTFKLDDIPQATEFRRVFDSYRINSIKITAAPLTYSSINSNPCYKFMWAIDLDDTTTETPGSIIQRSNVKIKTVTSGGNNPQVFNMSCRPRYLTQLYESDVTTGYGQGPRSQWLDCADPTIPYFGIKCVFDTDPTLNYDVVWQFYVTYYIEFKSLR